MRRCLMSFAAVVGARIDMHLDPAQLGYVVEEAMADLFSDGMALSDAAVSIHRQAALCGPWKAARALPERLLRWPFRWPFPS